MEGALLSPAAPAVLRHRHVVSVAEQRRPRCVRLEGNGFFLMARDPSSPAGNLVALVDDVQRSKAACDCTPALREAGAPCGHPVALR